MAIAGAPHGLAHIVGVACGEEGGVTVEVTDAAQQCRQCHASAPQTHLGALRPVGPQAAVALLGHSHSHTQQHGDGHIEQKMRLQHISPHKLARLGSVGFGQQLHHVRSDNLLEMEPQKEVCGEEPYAHSVTHGAHPSASRGHAHQGEHIGKNKAHEHGRHAAPSALPRQQHLPVLRIVQQNKGHHQRQFAQQGARQCTQASAREEAYRLQSMHDRARLWFSECKGSARREQSKGRCEAFSICYAEPQPTLYNNMCIPTTAPVLLPQPSAFRISVFPIFSRWCCIAPFREARGAVPKPNGLGDDWAREAPPSDGLRSCRK